MIPTMILSLALLGGDCSTGNCQTPQFFGGGFNMGQPTYLQPTYYAPQAPAQDIPMMARYWVNYEGMRFIVEGWRLTPGSNNVTWYKSHPFNALAYANARTEKAEKAANLASFAPRSTEPDGGPPWTIMYPKNKPTGDLPPTTLEPKNPPTGEIGQVAPVIQNFGLRPDKIGNGKASYTADSDEAKRFVQEAIADSGEAGKMHLTVIGTDDEQARVMNDIKTDPAFNNLRDTLLVQGYKPGEWPVDPSLGFQTNGKPSIYVQAAKGPGDAKGGRVLLRANDYSIGAKGLAEAIRKADPNYQPSNDPTPSSVSGSCPLGFTRDHWGFIVVVGVILLIVIYLPRKAG